ncbi:MAG: hypothetical protein SFT68_02550 [Rickettsiaceae bacterium]|nr:hypothetical protein [Rickettsiaceae bacterium]
MNNLENNLLEIWQNKTFPSAALIISNNLENTASILLKFFSSIFAAVTNISPLNNPDIIFIRPEESSEIKIAQIRKIHEEINMKASLSPFKFCVIVGAEHLNPNAANALLKPLEDPPSFTYFILITSNQKRIIPTILSRVIKIAEDIIPIDQEYASFSLIQFFLAEGISNKEKLDYLEKYIQQNEGKDPKFTKLTSEILEEIGRKRNNPQMSEKLIHLVSSIDKYKLDTRQVLLTLYVSILTQFTRA